MARINIFLPDEQLRVFDRKAEEEGISRSGLIQKAMEAYLDQAKREKEETERKARMEKAAARMDKLARKAGSWKPVKIIRRFRDTRYGTKS